MKRHIAQGTEVALEGGSGRGSSKFNNSEYVTRILYTCPH